MYHLPAGKWRVFVNFKFGKWGHYDPNSVSVYAEKILEEGEEVPPVYVLVTQAKTQMELTTVLSQLQATALTASRPTS